MVRKDSQTKRDERSVVKSRRMMIIPRHVLVCDAGEFLIDAGNNSQAKWVGRDARRSDGEARSEFARGLANFGRVWYDSRDLFLGFFMEHPSAASVVTGHFSFEALVRCKMIHELNGAGNSGVGGDGGADDEILARNGTPWENF